MIAILDAYRAGLLSPKHWLSNFTAGIVVGVVAIPLAMAFAIASGVQPQQGLYTAIVSALIVGLFGGSRVQIAGPTGAFIVILAAITAQFGWAGLQIATLLAGIILVLMGFMKLGNVIKFIPDPVIVGFTSGIGVIIFVGELKDFFGLPLSLPLEMSFSARCMALCHALPHFDVPTTSLAMASLALVWITPVFSKRVPGPLVAMIGATVLQAIFQFKTVATIGSAFGGISSVLPSFHLPLLTTDRVLHLIGPAFTIALLSAIESLLSATAADDMTKTKHHANQELIGQGLANILTPLFGGFASTGAIARTATNIKNGGNSPLAAIVHSLFLILVLVSLSPFAKNIPLCALAAILFVVAYHMSDVPRFLATFKKAPRHDILVLLTTFLLTIFTNLVVAVNVGVMLAMLLFIRRMIQSAEINMQFHAHPSEQGTAVYTIRGPIFFGTAHKIEHAFAAAHLDLKKIIFSLQDVPFIDMTGLEALRGIIEQCRERGVQIDFCEVNSRIIRQLQKIGIMQTAQ